MNYDAPAMLTITDYATATGVSRKTVSRMIDNDRLPQARKVDGLWLIPADAIPRPPARAGAAALVTVSPAAAAAALVPPVPPATPLELLEEATGYVTLDVASHILGISEEMIKANREEYQLVRRAASGRYLMPQSAIRKVFYG